MSIMSIRGFPNLPKEFLKILKESSCYARDSGDVGSIPGSGRFSGGGYGNPLWYCCLENPMDMGDW